MSARMSSADAKRLGLIEGKAGKYRVSENADRAHNGRLYASKAEMRYALDLEELVRMRQIQGFAEQPRVQLGADTVYRPDFIVIDQHRGSYFVDVKGAEPREFRRIKKLWAKYMRVELRVVKAKGPGFVTTETICQEF